MGSATSMATHMGSESVFGKGEGLNLLRSWGTQRGFLNSFSSVETLRNVENATCQNGSHEALLYGKEADWLLQL